MIRRPPRSTRTDTLFPYTTLFRSEKAGVIPHIRSAATAWSPLLPLRRPSPPQRAPLNLRVELHVGPRPARTSSPLRRQQMSDGSDKAAREDALRRGRQIRSDIAVRSEERRAGTEWVSTCSSSWSPYH